MPGLGEARFRSAEDRVLCRGSGCPQNTPFIFPAAAGGTKKLTQAGLTQKTIENGVKLRATSTPQRELEKLEKLRIRVITWKDKNYPTLLREIDDSPPVLYTYGKLTEANQCAFAVVGTRNSTTYGRQVTERIVTELAKGQVTIVS